MAICLDRNNGVELAFALIVYRYLVVRSPKHLAVLHIIMQEYQGYQVPGTWYLSPGTSTRYQLHGGPRCVTGTWTAISRINTDIYRVRVISIISLLQFRNSLVTSHGLLLPDWQPFLVLPLICFLLHFGVARTYGWDKLHYI